MSPFVHPQAVQPTDRILAWAVFCLLFGAYLATFSGLPDNPDAEVEFQTVSSLARKQSLALGGTSEADAIVGVAHQGRQGFNVHQGGPGREDEYFSWSGVAQPLLAFPLYLVGGFVGQLFPSIEARHRETTHLGVARSEYFEHLFVGLRNPLLGALTGALLVLASRRAGARRNHAVLSGLTYGLCSFAWPQARGTLSDVQATAALFLAFVLAQGTIERIERSRRPRIRSLLGFGLALGVAFLTRSVLAPAVAVLGLYFLIRVIQETRATSGSFPWRVLVAAFAPAIACLGLFLWLNQLRFGDPLESGYGGVVGLSWFLRMPWEGLVGATLSPGSGLIWFAPGLVLLVPWLLHCWPRREYELPLLLGALVVAIGVPHVLIPSWHGAWSYGPRYMLPLVPFLWIPVGVSLGLVEERPLLRALAWVPLYLGGVTALGGVLVEYNTNIDLTMQAARLEWPADPEAAPSAEEERVLDEARFIRSKFDWRFAAPWAHWRIFRHRIAGLGEDYSARELYYLPRDEILTPQWERERGFQHMAWVDLQTRLGGQAALGPLLALLFFSLSGALFLRVQEEEGT